MLFTFIGGSGHFLPLVPVARTAVAQGHIVAFACGSSMVATVEAAGFQAIQLGASGGSLPQRRPLRPLDAAREAQEFRDLFARQGAQNRVPHTVDLCLEWQPDVVICDETNFGGMVAAERLGLPYAVVLVMAVGSFVQTAGVEGALNELRAQYALPADPQLEMLHRYLVLSPFPPGFRDPAYPLPPTGHSIRPDAGLAVQEAPSWLSRLPAAPTVYFTLGTVFNMESGDLFSRALAGLRELPVNVIVTIGNELDPAELGPQPANVHVERYVPQDLILPHCDVIVSHGGSGSVSGALRYGRPSVLIPMGADQPLNAARCQELGLAQVLDPIAATPEAVHTAVANVLSDPGYRQAAQRFRTEFAALPGPDHAVQLLEQLAVGKRPVVG